MSNDWFRVDIDTVLSPEFLAQPLVVRAAWLSLHALASKERTGGTITGLMAWTPRMLDRACALTFAMVRQVIESGLASVSGTNLQLVVYDHEGDAKVAAKRKTNANNAKSRWLKHATASESQSKSHSEPDAVAMHVTRRNETVRDETVPPPAVADAVASHSDPEAKAVPKPPHRAEAEAWAEWFARKSGRRFTATGPLIGQVKSLMAAGHTQRQMRAVALYCIREWSSDPKMAKHVVPSTLLRTGKFQERLDLATHAGIYSGEVNHEANGVEARGAR